MAYTNSSTWREEAELRNSRKAKADSMSALLDHVDWNPDTLEISLSGITLKWGDIEGADNVAMKSDIPSDAYITRITENTIETGYLTANNLSIKGGYIDLQTASSSNIVLQEGSSGMAISPDKIVVSDNLTVYRDSSGKPYGTYAAGGVQLTGDGIIIAEEIHSGGYEVATTNTLSSYLKKSGNGLSDVGSGSFYVAVLDSGVFKYCTKSRMQEWLGIS